jgi:hypothetical protein
MGVEVRNHFCDQDAIAGLRTRFFDNLNRHGARGSWLEGGIGTPSRMRYAYQSMPNGPLRSAWDRLGPPGTG